MATVLKCKMCGGTLQLQSDETIAICEYCGTKQTLPKIDSERKAQLYDRANHFRRSNEYDKAATIYEQILNEDTSDAEAYWSLVLCRYGIEYVEDPQSHKRVPTVNRAQFSSVFADDDYLMALKYADALQQEIYEEEAKAIDEIQKGILAISKQEEPFDVFICYKETDSYGRRTADSVYAQDIYKALTEEGYKVFFSRITLEDKLGTAYEPYIFAALNSAKVMIVLGTKTEYFNAVWVKNEWSRYLSLIKNGKKKTLIPVYKDITAYDLPEEFAYIQAQDMSVIGFMQDLVRGVKKIIPKDKQETITGGLEEQMASSMLKKAYGFLGMGDMEAAKQCLNMVYTYEPDNAEYYVGMLMLKYRCQEVSDLAKVDQSIVEEKFYQKAMQNGDDKLKDELLLLAQHTMYNEARNISEKHGILSDYQKAMQMVEEIRVEEIKLSDKEFAKDIEALKKQLKQQIETVEEENREKQQKEDKRKKRNLIFKRVCLAIILVFVMSVVGLWVVYSYIKPRPIYEEAISCMQEGKYEKAIELFSTIIDYKDVAELVYSIEDKQIEACQIGDEIVFGRQGKTTDRFYSAVYTIGKRGDFSALSSLFGMEERPLISWIVLERQEDKVLLLSKDCLVAKEYNKSKKSTWQDSDLNSWLNNEFYTASFSEMENKRIVQRKNLGQNNKLFLLNQEEIMKYMPTAASRQAYATEIAIKNGIQVADNGHSCWWTRSDKSTQQVVPVLSTGEFSEDAIYAANDFVGVRPAVWISLSDDATNMYADEIEVVNTVAKDGSQKKVNDSESKKLERVFAVEEALELLVFCIIENGYYQETTIKYEPTSLEEDSIIECKLLNDDEVEVTTFEVDLTTGVCRDKSTGMEFKLK
ncbi:MAG: toll/interleukin-1 receptor domain-containing protein [Lachnospiraceae bacterium]|nr:toll/interleukin-1 receptor domain-containing protein [Lachnospiraceae bacterium]